MTVTYHQLLKGSHGAGIGDSYRRWNYAENGKDPQDAGKYLPVIVPSEQNLSAIHPGKFQPWHGPLPAGLKVKAAQPAPAFPEPAPTAVAVNDDGLDAKSLEEVKAIALAEGVELGAAASRKDRAVEKLRKSREDRED